MKELLTKIHSLTLGNNQRSYSDIYIAAIIICIVLLLVVPVPAWLLDTLITLNLMLSVILLMMAIYVPGVLSFSTFPSVLLITTLFRLAINITSTRMILMEASAGEIIFTFGNFVVGGNFIVGTVLFLILLIIQFIVITKGAERVAEVAARFTLDAMPGKQMSIDADMRAGVIDIREAQNRRGTLEKESQLFGAMDGAMKFVKGDAIASLIIVAINITAGICIGVFQNGLAVSQAVTTYSVLTIGDGLISQIPALLISITAGMITTRVSSDECSGLGTDIFKQISAVPKAIIIGGVILGGFSIIPGFPKLQFVLISVAVTTLGVTLQRNLTKSKPMALATQKRFSLASSLQVGEGQEDNGLVFSTGILVDIDQDVQRQVSPLEFRAEFVKARRALRADLGVPFPEIHLRFGKFQKGGFSYQILLQEIPVSRGTLQPESLYVHADSTRLHGLGIDFTPVLELVDQRQASWVPKTFLHSLQQLDIAFMKPSELLAYHVSLVLRGHAWEFLGLQETRGLLNRMEKEYGEVTREVQRVVPIQRITEVLQRLVQEGVSIRNLNTIFHALVEWGGREKDPALLAEYVRIALRRYMSHHFSKGKGVLAAYLIEPKIEEEIRKAIRQTSSGSFLALEPTMALNIVNAAKSLIGEATHLDDILPVVLTSMDIRRYTRKLLEIDLPTVPVLSHQELTEEIQIRPLGKIGIE